MGSQGTADAAAPGAPPGSPVPGPGTDRLSVADLWSAALLFLLAGLVYELSPITMHGDSVFSLQVASSLLHGRGGELSPWRPAISTWGSPDLKGSYQVRTVGDRLYSTYSIGTPLLAVPFLMGVEHCAPARAERLTRALDVDLERMIAAWIAAAAVPLLFLAARRRGAGSRGALVATLAFAFGTSQWSTSSRALWQHGPLVLCESIALLALAGPELSAPEALLAGLALGYGFLVRQSAAIVLGLVGLAVWREHPWSRTALLVLGCLPSVLLLLAYHAAAFGGAGTPYYGVVSHGLQAPWEGMAGLLVSPSRGLLVFSPVMIFAFFGFWRRLGGPDANRLDLASGLACVVHWVVCASFNFWSGGHSYGPRYMTDLLPFLTLFLAHAWDLLQHERRRGAMAVLIVLGLVSGWIHHRGACDWAVWRWNGIEPEAWNERMWRWSDPQFLAGP